MSDGVVPRIEREQRLASNESVYREVNERIAEIADRLEAAENERWEYFCECAAPDCADRIALTCDEYAHVRERANRFVVAPGHVVPQIERVVERFDEYEIVEKEGEAGREAVRLEAA